MSGIGETAYTLLLGWMRGLVNWLWALFSGNANTGLWQWFLSNWKIWLLILLIGGLVADWLMWIIRWRPYKVLFGRFRKKGAVEETDDAVPEEAWDDGVGYYEPETAVDADTAEWANTTFSSLSELDPDWAGNVVIDEDDGPLYDPEYTPTNAHTTAFPLPSLADELPTDDYELPSYGDLTQPAHQQPAAYEQTDYYAPYDDQSVNAYAPEPAAATAGNTGPLMYGRPGMWPGAQYPFADNGQQDMGSPPPPVPEETVVYDPLFNPDAPMAEPPPRRRRRRLRESLPDDPIPVLAYEQSYTVQPKPEPAQPLPQFPEDDRPSRVVEPVRDEKTSVWANLKKRREKEDDEFKTVLGKPAKRRGLMKFTAAQDEPISGLPPLDLTDPFLPAIHPNDPDFDQDD